MDKRCHWVEEDDVVVIITLKQLEVCDMECLNFIEKIIFEKFDLWIVAEFELCQWPPRLIGRETRDGSSMLG